MDRTKLKQELIRDEGIYLTPYKDSLGYWTIGVGHLLGDKRMISITPAESEALLNYDIDNACDIAYKLAPNVFNDFYDIDKDVRERALVNMAFNLGTKLSQFKKFLAAVNSQNWKVAAIEMMDSMWAKQVGHRAERLRDMILGKDDV